MSYQLERTRNNQRRSRARKRDYIATLEARIQDCEQSRRDGSLRGSDDDRDTVDKLQQENGRLSLLLEAIGINKDFQHSYLGTEGLSPLVQVVGEDTIGNLQGESSTSALTVPNQQQQSIGWPQPPITVEFPGPALPADEWNQNPLVNSTFSLSTPLPPGMMVHPQTQPPQSFHNMALNPDAISLVTQLLAASPDGLTPCSLAYSLAYRYNRKGHETAYLDFRLYIGYRACTAVGDGCVVENKVLFGVLADIS
ncbi:bZIP transcription factor [Aspergillus puulaauensis]|uniref:BZIP domain-containing protein n=1 Tax=Aspergillus puulaauensis TaxID=1220207 RepID=A0A7R8ANI8_9EURO|nr:uncharacterized protein APUU_40109S [Aspergillus puulaauensis]BCS23665.1 hypothetical protein APUU_40109S [Aspergillus puulaauensis]